MVEKLISDILSGLLSNLLMNKEHTSENNVCGNCSSYSSVYFLWLYNEVALMEP